MPGAPRPTDPEALRAYRNEVNRRYRERNPELGKQKWAAKLASMTPDELTAFKQRRHDAYVARRARDLESFNAKGRESARRQREKDPDAYRAKHRAYYAADPERHRAYVAAYGRRESDVLKDKQYRRYYGLTLAEYQAMADKQGHRCALCNEPESMTMKGKLKALSVDHDHETGAVRALLCSRCNRALGFFRDDPDAMEAAAVYVRAHRSKLKAVA